MFKKIDPAAIIRHPRTRQWAIRATIFIAVVGLLGFFVAPPVLKSILVSKLGEALHRDVSIASISFNPYTLTANVSGVSVRERGDGKSGEEVFGFDSLTVNAELTSVAVAGVVIKEVLLVGPRVRLVRLDDKRYNISDLIEAPQSGPEAPTPPKNEGGLPRFSVSNIQISGGKIEFDDRPEGVKHAVSDIALKIPFLSTLSYYADTFVEPHFSASINGAPLLLSGKSRPFDDSLESELMLDLDDLQLARYLAYSPVALPIRMVSGALDGELRLRFVQTKKQPSTLSLVGKVALKDLKVEESAGASLLAMKRLEVTLREVDLLKLNVGVESIVVEAPQVDVRISKEGVSNWHTLMPADTKEKVPEKKAEPASPSPLQLTLASLAVSDGVVNVQDLSTGVEQKGSFKNLQFAIRDSHLDLKKREVRIGEFATQGWRATVARSDPWFKAPLLRAAVDVYKEKEAPFLVAVDRIRLSDQQFLLEDSSSKRGRVQSLEIASLDIDGFSTQAEVEAKLAAKLRLNKSGEVDISGSLKPMLPQGKLDLDVRGIELLPFQPYFKEFLNLRVTSGQITAKGALTLDRAKGADGVAVGYKGDLTLGKFHSIDRANSADFLRWRSFYLGDIELQTAPLGISVGEVALSDFYARVIVSPEGQLNLMHIVKRDEPAAAVPEKAAVDALAEVSAEPLSDTPKVESGDGKAAVKLADKPVKEVVPVKIGKVTLQGGTINFSDNFVKPNYSANLTKIGGRVSGLSSAAGSMADLELRGSYDNLAPLNIKAKLNPFSATSYLDLDAEVKGIELTSFSTYSGKYAGYAIERGKLSLFLKYMIENNQLVADNRVFLDQLTFGEPVESASATKLPVTLAVSLLKNRNGEIDINLPISGSLDDPEFSVGGIVVKVIVNLFVKAVTSPFALLGSLFGGGEELAYVEFDYGYAALSAPMQERMKTLAKALDDRPALKIELAGRIDAERDREGLKRALMEQRVKAKRLEDMGRQGQEAGSVDDVEVDAKDYPRYLERAYRAEKFPKPRNLIGMVKDLPVEEMEKLMMANMKADDEALRDLAGRRARKVSEWLTQEGKIPGERVFILQPNLSAKEGPQNDKAKESRVDFALK
jgi:uncharacterized membrane protein